MKNALGLPGTQLPELIGECFSVPRELEGVNGKHGGRGVMSVGRSGLWREPGREDVGPKCADHAHDVRQDGLPVPDPQRFVIVLGIAEVFRAREVLPPPIQPPRREQFLRASHAQLLAEVRAEEVLTPVPAGEREIGGPVSTTPGQIGDDLRVLIVGMRGDVEHASHGVEVAQFFQDGLTGWELSGLAEPDAAGHEAYG